MRQIWNVEIARPARKELSRLPTHVQTRVARAILALETILFHTVARNLEIGMVGASGSVIIGCSTLPIPRPAKLS